MNEHVTAREKQVLLLIAEGRSTKQIAFELGIAFKTVATHRASLIAKFHVANTAELVYRSVQGGLIPCLVETTPVKTANVPAKEPLRDDELASLAARYNELKRAFQSNETAFRTACLDVRKTASLIASTMRAGRENRPVSDWHPYGTEPLLNISGS